MNSEPLLNGRFSQAEHARTVHVANTDAAYEDVLKPPFWTNIAKKVVKGDQIEVYAADGTYFALLLVTGVQKLSLTVVELLYKEIESPERAETAQFYVEHCGPNLLNCVIRKSDGFRASTGHQTKEKALADMLQREREVA